ncbi:hypothetical protein OAU50_04510 [Planctomycetota bacterium]|nr:hypothetical protein [Planctomycetota bacterium]
MGCEADCCIEEIKIYGHYGSGYGGGDAPLKPHLLKMVQGLLCEDAIIDNYQCLGCSINWESEDDFRKSLVDVLSKGGGTIKAYSGEVTYWYEEKYIWNPLGENWKYLDYGTKRAGDGEEAEFEVKKGDTQDEFKKRYEKKLKGIRDRDAERARQARQQAHDN